MVDNENVTKSGYKLADPPPELWIPPEQRRELLLDDGGRVFVALELSLIHI